MFKPALTNLRTILCLSAHSDDIEIGCGGTVLKLLNDHPGLHVHWVVLSSDEQRAAEATSSAEVFLDKAANPQIEIAEFKDSYFPSEWSNIKDYFHRLQSEIKPDLILTHRRNDMHQDHRVVAELTWCAFRDHLILEYEIPKYEGDLGTPNLFVPLSREICHKKVETICNSFASQRDKQWFSDETFWSMLRIRGLEANSPSLFAEAFDSRKLAL